MGEMDYGSEGNEERAGRQQWNGFSGAQMAFRLRGMLEAAIDVALSFDLKQTWMG